MEMVWNEMMQVRETVPRAQGDILTSRRRAVKTWSAPGMLLSR